MHIQKARILVPVPVAIIHTEHTWAAVADGFQDFLVPGWLWDLKDPREL